MTNREGKRIWTGDYVCSICGLHFRPDPTDPSKLSVDFSAHKDQHAAVDIVRLQRDSVLK
jgi:hypothetical protein